MPACQTHRSAPGQSNKTHQLLIILHEGHKLSQEPRGAGDWRPEHHSGVQAWISSARLPKCYLVGSAFAQTPDFSTHLPTWLRLQQHFRETQVPTPIKPLSLTITTGGWTLSSAIMLNFKNTSFGITTRHTGVTKFESQISF